MADRSEHMSCRYLVDLEANGTSVEDPPLEVVGDVCCHLILSPASQACVVSHKQLSLILAEMEPTVADIVQAVQALGDRSRVPGHFMGWPVDVDACTSFASRIPHFPFCSPLRSCGAALLVQGPFLSGWEISASLESSIARIATGLHWYFPVRLDQIQMACDCRMTWECCPRKVCPIHCVCPAFVWVRSGRDLLLGCCCNTVLPSAMHHRRAGCSGVGGVGGGTRMANCAVVGLVANEQITLVARIT